MNRTPRPRPCPVCREEFTPKRIGLKVTKCCLNASCVLDYAQGLRAKDFDRETRSMKSRLLDNDKSHWKAKHRRLLTSLSAQGMPMTGVSAATNLATGTGNGMRGITRPLVLGQT